MSILLITVSLLQVGFTYPKSKHRRNRPVILDVHFRMRRALLLEAVACFLLLVVKDCKEVIHS